MAGDLPSESQGHPSPRMVLDEMHHRWEYLAGSKPIEISSVREIDTSRRVSMPGVTDIADGSIRAERPQVVAFWMHWGTTGAV